MTNPILEENVERLLRRCVPRIPAEQVERSLARAERRKAGSVRTRALPVTAAAAAAIAIAAWLVLSSRPETQDPGRKPAQDQSPPSAKEIETLIADLGSPSDAREKAERRLREIGKPALEALDKALYHENPDVRVTAQSVARAIRKDLGTQEESAKAKAAGAPVRAAVKKVRERWAARDFKNIEDVVREAFLPAQLLDVHYVPKKNVGQDLQLGSSRNEGLPDSITPEMAKALDGKEGLIFFDRASWEVVEYAQTLFFTLPDKQGWSAYVYVRLPDPKLAAEKFKSRLLAAGDDRQVWGIEATEIPDLPAYVERLLSEGTELSESPGGLKIKALKPGSLGASRSLRTGDVVREINGSPVKDLASAKAAVTAPPGGAGPLFIRITVERDGKSCVLEYRPLPR